MGLTRNAYSLLCELNNLCPEPFSGSSLQLGKQDSYVKDYECRRILRKFNIKCEFNEKNNSFIDSYKLFNYLGFDNVFSLDYSDYEGSEIIHNFNEPLPKDFGNKYNLVFDGGTTEHIFNINQSLKNICDLLKVGGIAVHSSPTNNQVDHGYLQFSPQFFYDFYKINNFKIIQSYLIEVDAAPRGKKWLIREYTPGCIDYLSMGGWSEILDTWIAVQKTSESTSDKIPQQGDCVKAWNININENISEKELIQKTFLSSQLKALIKKSPFKNKLFKFKKHLIRLISRKKPPIKNRY